MGYRWSPPTAVLVLAAVVACGRSPNPVSPAPSTTPAASPMPTPTPPPPLANVPGFRLTSISPPSGSTVTVSRCELPGDIYPQSAAVQGAVARPLHDIGDCTINLAVKLDVQVAESALTRIFVQFLNGDAADGGVPCASASWTGTVEAGSAREFVFNNFELWCDRSATTNRLLITVTRCAPDQPRAPCPTVLAREQFEYAYRFGASS